MSKVPDKLLDYMQQVEKKHKISKEVLNDIFTNFPIPKNWDDYQLAFYVEKKLELNKGYFSIALRKGYEIKASIQNMHGHIYVKLDDEIIKLLKDGFVGAKIKPGEVDEYDHVIKLTKNTILGFYK